MKKSLRFAVAGIGTVLVLGTAAVALELHASSASIHHTCEVGQQTIYRIGYVSRDSSSPGAVFGSRQGDASTQDYHLRLTGVLTATASACDATGTTTIFNVVQPNITLDGSGTSVLFSALLDRDLSHPYVVRSDAAGRVVTLAADPASGTLGTALMRRIVAQMEVVAPDRPALTARSWHVAESDVAGTRESTYTVEPWVTDPFGARAIAFHRTSGTYVDPPNDGRMIRHATIHGVGNDSGSYGLDGALDSLDTSYAEETLVGENIVARSQVVYEAVRLAAPMLGSDRFGPIAIYGNKLLKSESAAPLHAEEPESVVDRRAFASTLGHETATTLARALARLPAKTDARARAGLADTFAALFYVHPATLATFYPQMLAASGASNAFGVFVPALEHADSVASQQTLVRLFQARASSSVGPGLAAGLGLLERPIPAVQVALQRAAAGSTSLTARAAELGLGTIAWTVSMQDPARGHALASAIAQRLHAAHSSDLVQLELLALGNTRDPAELSAIAAYAGDRDDNARAGTAVALRHQSSSTADETLVTLLHDRASIVRIGAADAFQSRNPGPAAYLALQGVAHNDRNESVRSDAVLSLWKARADHPDAVAFVRDVAANDPDSGVRKSAQSAIDADSDASDLDTQSPMDRVLGDH